MWRAWILCVLVAILTLACDGERADSRDAEEVSSEDTVEADTTPVDVQDEEVSVPAPTSPPWLRDEAGGAVILRGTNVTGTAKWTDDLLPPPDEAPYARLRDELGFNAVRFLVFWEAIEPEPGAYDEAYLAAVRGHVEAAMAAGHVVMVDMHQDVFGRGFGSAGAPRWACDEALYASWEAPEVWFDGYFTPEVQACFVRFWTEEETRAAFRGAWARLARELASVEGMLLVDLLNEPHWGSLDVGRFESEILPEVYGALIEVIRAERPGTWVALEPSSLANLGIATRLALPEAERLIYAPHFYPPAMELGDGYDGDADALLTHMRTAYRDATRMEVPLLWGEFGGRAEVPGVEDFMRDTYEGFDGLMVGALQWEGGVNAYGVWARDGEGAIVASAIGAVTARPFPRRVAGEPLSWLWDAQAGRFELRWTEAGSATGETVIAAPSLAFPDGFDASLADGGVVRVEGSLVRVPRADGGVEERALVLERR